MQTKSDENAICMPPISNSSIEIPTVKKTKAIVNDKRLLLELNRVSNWVNSHPINAPTINERIISRIGSTKMDVILNAPSLKAIATPKETAKTIRATASSKATTGRRISVNFPLALY